MSLSSAISNALTGLSAASRGTEVVSTNIANKSVAGYARREVDLSSRVYSENGGGVSIDGVSRQMNAGLLADDRFAQAAVANSGMLASFHATMEGVIGTSDDTASLTSLVTQLDTALVSASADPSNDVRLGVVLNAAQDLAGKINDVAKTIQSARVDADKSIANDVAKLNDALERVAKLNRQITVVSARGEDSSSLMDARQATIDEIATIIPVKEIAREEGRVALYTKSGTALLDGTNPVKIGFTAATQVNYDMTLANGSLSALSVNGKELSASEMGAISGGTLAANFAVRDEIAPSYQAQIDGFAKDLYDRFADPALDATLSTGEPGIFVAGTPTLTAANELGAANRLAVSAQLDPAQGGDLWRIRAGVNATDAGNSGESGLLLAMSAALSASQSTTSPAFSANARTLLSLGTEMTSAAASQRIRSEATSAQDSSHAVSLRTTLLAQGVDEDSEMESLLSLERAYTANAKVFQTANDMLDQILGLK